MQEVTTDLIVNLPPFRVYPAYFSLANGEVMEINVEFSPTDFGLHLNKILVVCDNCTYDSIDLIGDGVYFQLDLVRLQVILIVGDTL